MSLSIQHQKLRDRKENEVRIAVEHQRLQRVNMRIYKKSALTALKKYETWCEHRGITPTINMQELYNQVNQ